MIELLEHPLGVANAIGKPPQLLFNAIERTTDDLPGFVPMTTWRGSWTPFAFGGWPHTTKTLDVAALRANAARMERFVALDFEDLPHNQDTIRRARQMIQILREEGIEQITWYNRVRGDVRINASGGAYWSAVQSKPGSVERAKWFALTEQLRVGVGPNGRKAIKYGLDAACDMLCADVYLHYVPAATDVEARFIERDATVIQASVDYLNAIDAKKPKVLFMFPLVIDAAGQPQRMSDERMAAYWAACWSTGAHCAIWGDCSGKPYDDEILRFAELGRRVARGKL